MTKRVRIENADGSPYKLVVEVWEGGRVVREIDLDYPTAMTPEDLYIWGGRHLVVKEKLDKP